MSLKSITENTFFLFIAHLIFPPFASWLLTKNTSDTLKDQFEGRIRLSTVWGVSIDVVVGLLVLTVLLAINLWFPGLLSISTPILIAIPWVTSVVGKGLGIIHGLFKTLQGPKFVLPVIWSALKVALTGDAFTRIEGFYACFFSPYPVVTANSALLNDVLAQNLVLMIDNGLLETDMLTDSSAPVLRFPLILMEVIKHILNQQPNVPLILKTHFPLKSSDDLSIHLKQTLDKVISNKTGIHTSGAFIETYKQASKDVHIYLRNCISEVTRQINLLQANHIDPRPYVEKITEMPGRTSMWINRLLLLKGECVTQEHFEEYNSIFTSYLSSLNAPPSDKAIVDFFTSCSDLETAFKTGVLDESDRRLTLNFKSLNYLDLNFIENRLKEFLKLRGQGRLLKPAAHREIFSRPTTISSYASLNTSSNLEEKKPPPNDQSEQKRELEPQTMEFCTAFNNS